MRPQETEPNLEHMLNHYGIKVRSDVIKKELLITLPGKSGKPSDESRGSINNIVSLCNKNGLPKKEVQEFLIEIGDRNPINPVMDFIESKPWDGVSRFKDLLDTIQTKPGYSRDLLSMLLKRWMISAVAAAAMPSGFKSKGVLVFQGPQDAGKTTWFQNLLPKELIEKLMKDGLTLDPQNKDSVMVVNKFWIVEFGELDATTRKADIAAIKSFIGQPTDHFRPPYGRIVKEFQRRTVFCASVNPEEFLVDDTGNVRWWTIPVIGLNYDHGIDMQQMWAEALVWYRNGDKWWLSKEEKALLEAANEKHRQCDPIEERILSLYGEAVGNRKTEPKTATDVLLKIGYDRPTKPQKNVAANALRKYVGEPKRTKHGLFFNVPLIY